MLILILITSFMELLYVGFRLNWILPPHHKIMGVGHDEAEKGDGIPPFSVKSSLLDSNLHAHVERNRARMETI